MKGYLIILFLFGTFFLIPLCEAQSTLVLKSGELVACSDLSLVSNPDQVITVSNGKIVCFPVEKVRGFFKDRSRELKYLMLTCNPGSEKLEWQFLEREVDGKISLGSVVFNSLSTSHYGGAVNNGGRIYYADDGTRYGIVCSTERYQSKGVNEIRIQRVKELTSDLPGFDLSLDSIAKKWNSNDVIELIERYNMKMHHPTSKPGQGTAAVNFFLRPNAVASSVRIIIDDNQEFELTAKKTVTVVLPDYELAKVCVISTASKQCFLVRGERCCQKFYQVKQNDEKGKLVVEKSDINEAARFVSKGISK